MPLSGGRIARYPIVLLNKAATNITSDIYDSTLYAMLQTMSI
jgi:hypothetical protein